MFANVLGAYAAEIIAVCALAFTAYQAYVQRWHNVLSVTPHITTFTRRNRDSTLGQLGLILMNNGLGPAFVEKFQVYLSGQPCAAQAAVDSLLKEQAIVTTSVTTLGDDYAMPAGEARVLLSVTFPCCTEEDLNKMQERLNKLDLELHYSSAYRKRFKYDSRERKPLRSH